MRRAEVEKVLLARGYLKHAPVSGLEKVDALHSRPKAVLHVAPLMKTGTILKAVFGPKAYERVFGPVIADALHEWYAAELSGNYKLSSWVRIRATIDLMRHALLFVPLYGIRKLVEAMGN